MRTSDPGGKMPKAAAVQMMAMAIAAPPIAPAAAVPNPDLSMSSAPVRIGGGNGKNIGGPLPIRRARRQLVLRQRREMAGCGEVAGGVVQLRGRKICHGFVAGVAVGLRRFIPRKGVIILLSQHDLEIVERGFGELRLASRYLRGSEVQPQQRLIRREV